MLRDLIDKNLLDDVALDYKCPPKLAEKLLGTSRFEKPFRESLKLLIAASRKGKIKLEIRTTVAPTF